MPAPTTTLQTIFDRARGTYLNDAAGRVWLNEKMLPYFKTAYDEFQTELNNNDLETIDAVADPLVIVAGDVVYDPLPTDFVWPVKLQERAQGSTGLYDDMAQLRWNTNITPSTNLRYWSFYGDAITFPEATTNREVLLYYKQLYPTIPTTSGDPVIDASTTIYGHSISALSARVAGLIHRFANQNFSLADQLDATWKSEAFNVVNMYVKKKQSLPARPKPFRGMRNGWWNA